MEIRTFGFVSVENLIIKTIVTFETIFQIPILKLIKRGLLSYRLTTVTQNEAVLCGVC